MMGSAASEKEEGNNEPPRNDITRLNACQIPHVHTKACVPPMKGYKLGDGLYFGANFGQNRYPGISA
jgi:hypothetical protein